MKVVFSLEKYSVIITEDNWNCNNLPQKGDKINLYWFAEFLGDKNVTKKEDTIKKMNEDSKNPIFCVKDFLGSKIFTVDEVVWDRDYDGIYYQVNLIV